MLWYKGWLETRFQAVFVLLFAVFPIALFTLATPHRSKLCPSGFCSPGGKRLQFLRAVLFDRSAFAGRIGNQNSVRSYEERPPRLDVFHAFAARQPLSSFCHQGWVRHVGDDRDPRRRSLRRADRSSSNLKITSRAQTCLRFG